MQIKEHEAPSLLPTLNAFDTEFGYRDEQRTGTRRTEEGAPMNARFTPSQFEFPTHARAGHPSDAIEPSSHAAPVMRRSLGGRVLRRLTRFLLVLCVGAGTTLAWQSYGDAARGMLAKSSPQLAWLAPQTAPVVPSGDAGAAPSGPPSIDVQKLALGLAAVRQSVDQLAAQLAAGHQQIGGDIAKMQADEQEILHKLSANAPRPAAAPAHKPAPVAPPATPSVQPR